MLFINSIMILLLNVFTVECDQVCDCKEINIVMDVLQNEIFERKMMYSRLLAKMQKIEENQKSVTGLGDIQDSGTKGCMKTTNWDNWSLCSVTCGGGVRERSRSYTNSKPADNSKECKGVSKEKEICNTARCRVDGRWTDWSSWGACSVTCGEGIRERSRFCAKSLFSNLPDMSYCGGITEEKESCNNARCPEDGGWTNWESWGSCSLTCGDGIRERSRSCRNPRPSKNGRECKGSFVDKGSCNIARCHVDGRWTEWSSWNPCSVTCGDGVRERSRFCAKSLFSKFLNMSYCKGNTEQREMCNNARCPEDGGWTNWSTWSTCSATCGYGVRKRSRSCTNPRPLENGTLCEGVSIDKEICKTVLCPVEITDGGWTHWSRWGICSETCGNGIMQKTRSCTNPRPKGSGKQCEGRNVTIIACSHGPCPRNNY